MIHPEEMPYDQGLMFQDGRPLIYDTGDFPASLQQGPGAGRLGRLRADAGRRPGARDGGSASVSRPMWRVPASGPYEGAHVRVETTGDVVVSTGLTTQGQGHETVFAQIAAQELGVPVERVTVTTGDTRRFKYGVGTFASRAAVMSGNAVADRRAQGRAKALRLAAQRSGRRSRASSSSPTGRSRSGASRPTARASPWPRWPCCPTRCGTPSTRRRSGRRSSPRRPATGRRCRKGRSPGSRRPAGTRRSARPSPTACTRRWSRPIRRRPRSRCCATAWCTTAARSSTR